VVERCQIPVSTVEARKNAIVQAGMFDETLVRCDAYDMWLRTAFHGAKIVYSRTPQARLGAAFGAKCNDLHFPAKHRLARASDPRAALTSGN
jgi:hypothetical protein